MHERWWGDRSGGAIGGAKCSDTERRPGTTNDRAVAGAQEKPSSEMVPELGFLVEKTISYSNLADIRSRVAALHGSVNTETTTIAHHANPCARTTDSG